MKKLFSLVVVLSLILGAATTLNAQTTIEITPSYGYQFGSKLNFGANYLKIDDSDEYGLTVGVEVQDGIFAELGWIHSSTELRIRDIVISPTEQRLADLNVDWFQLGATKYFNDGKIKPFVGGGLGLVFFGTKNENRAITNRNLDNGTNFFFAFDGGVQIMVTDNIGFNLQGNLRFPVEWGGFYVGVGTGGVGGGVGVQSTTIIGSFSGGLVFKFDATGGGSSSYSNQSK